MAEALIKYETIDSDQIEDIMDGKPVREPADWRNDKDRQRKPLTRAVDEAGDNNSLETEANRRTASADGQTLSEH